MEAALEAELLNHADGVNPYDHLYAKDGRGKLLRVDPQVARLKVHQTTRAALQSRSLVNMTTTSATTFNASTRARVGDLSPREHAVATDLKSKSELFLSSSNDHQNDDSSSAEGSSHSGKFPVGRRPKRNIVRVLNPTTGIFRCPSKDLPQDTNSSHRASPASPATASYFAFPPSQDIATTMDTAALAIHPNGYYQRPPRSDRPRSSDAALERGNHGNPLYSTYPSPSFQRDEDNNTGFRLPAIRGKFAKSIESEHEARFSTHRRPGSGLPPRTAVTPIEASPSPSPPPEQVARHINAQRLCRAKQKKPAAINSSEVTTARSQVNISIGEPEDSIQSQQGCYDLLKIDDSEPMDEFAPHTQGSLSVQQETASPLRSSLTRSALFDAEIERLRNNASTTLSTVTVDSEKLPAAQKRLRGGKQNRIRSYSVGANRHRAMSPRPPPPTSPLAQALSNSFTEACSPTPLRSDSPSSPLQRSDSPSSPLQRELHARQKEYPSAPQSRLQHQQLPHQQYPKQQQQQHYQGMDWERQVNTRSPPKSASTMRRLIPLREQQRLRQGQQIPPTSARSPNRMLSPQPLPGVGEQRRGNSPHLTVNREDLQSRSWSQFPLTWAERGSSTDKRGDSDRLRLQLQSSSSYNVNSANATPVMRNAWDSPSSSSADWSASTDYRNQPSPDADEDAFPVSTLQFGSTALPSLGQPVGSVVKHNPSKPNTRKDRYNALMEKRLKMSPEEAVFMNDDSDFVQYVVSFGVQGSRFTTNAHKRERINGGSSRNRRDKEKKPRCTQCSIVRLGGGFGRLAKATPDGKCPGCGLHVDYNTNKEAVREKIEWAQRYQKARRESIQRGLLPAEGFDVNFLEALNEDDGAPMDFAGRADTPPSGETDESDAEGESRQKRSSRERRQRRRRGDQQDSTESCKDDDDDQNQRRRNRRQRNQQNKASQDDAEKASGLPKRRGRAGNVVSGDSADGGKRLKDTEGLNDFSYGTQDSNGDNDDLKSQSSLSHRPRSSQSSSKKRRKKREVKQASPSPSPSRSTSLEDSNKITDSRPVPPAMTEATTLKQFSTDSDKSKVTAQPTRSNDDGTGADATNARSTEKPHKSADAAVREATSGGQIVLKSSSKLGKGSKNETHHNQSSKSPTKVAPAPTSEAPKARVRFDTQPEVPYKSELDLARTKTPNSRQSARRRLDNVDISGYYNPPSSDEDEELDLIYSDSEEEADETRRELGEEQEHATELESNAPKKRVRKVLPRIPSVSEDLRGKEKKSRFKRGNNLDAILEGFDDGETQSGHNEIVDYIAQYSNMDTHTIEYYRKIFDLFDHDNDNLLDTYQLAGALQHLSKRKMSSAELWYIASLLDVIHLKKLLDEGKDPNKHQYQRNAQRGSGKDMGDVSFRLFCVVATLAQRLTKLNSSAKGHLDSLKGRVSPQHLQMACNLFYVNDPNKSNFIPLDILDIEMQAGNLKPEHRQRVLNQMRYEGIEELSFLDYLAYIPLFFDIHEHIVDNPLESTRQRDFKTFDPSKAVGRVYERAEGGAETADAKQAPKDHA